MIYRDSQYVDEAYRTLRRIVGLKGVALPVLLAIGWFLFSYHGKDRGNDVDGYLACLFALGVALFPTTSGCRRVQVVHHSFASEESCCRCEA